jgi:hypothetical protein
MQTRFYAGGPSSGLRTVLRGNEDRTDFVCGGGRARAETTRKWQAIKEKAGRKIACPVFSGVPSLGQNRRNRQPSIGGWARSHFLDAIGRDERPRPSVSKNVINKWTSSRIQAKPPPAWQSWQRDPT